MGINESKNEFAKQAGNIEIKLDKSSYQSGEIIKG